MSSDASATQDRILFVLCIRTTQRRSEKLKIEMQHIVVYYTAA